MRRTKRAIAAAALLALAGAVTSAAAGPDGFGLPDSLRERQALQNSWLGPRFETVLPALMRREGIDLWLVICREHNEDPVYRTLVPGPSMFAWRLTMLAFALGPGGVERLSLNRWGSGDLHKAFGDFYRPAWEPEALDPWERLARLVRERNPRKIAVDRSPTFAFADGLTAEMEARLRAALGPGLAGRVVSAERLAVGWLETRTPAEVEAYRGIVARTHALVDEAFSRSMIEPGKTTVDDLGWAFRERLAALALDTWFPPMFTIARPEGAPADRVIRPGDVVRCDVGATVLGLNSDVQRLAYVLRPGETSAPAGIAAGIAAANRLQDIVMAEMRPGRTGNEILAAALAKARAEGLDAKVYGHPIGVHGHAAGPRIGLPDMQGGVPGPGDYPLFADTCHAVELMVRLRVPEWGGREVAFPLEEDVVVGMDGPRFLDGRQTAPILVK